VNKIRAWEQAGKSVVEELKPLRVMQIDGEYLVRNGAHRLKALLQCGCANAPIVFDNVDSNQQKTYGRELKSRIDAGYRGGEKLVVCKTDKERQKLTL